MFTHGVFQANRRQHRSSLFTRGTQSPIHHVLAHLPALHHLSHPYHPHPQIGQTRWTKVHLIALDIKGAFDTVWHNGLCAKLMTKGVSGEQLTWIRGYPSDRSIRVVLSSQSSSTCYINASFPQRSILGPLLFSVFIDDLSADDSDLFCEIETSDDPVAKTASLSRDLSRMKNWTDHWNVTF